MYLVPNIHPGSGSAGVPTVQANFAGSPADWTTLSSTSTMPTGGSISRAGNAMLYDSTGKLTYAPNNVWLQNNTFATSPWYLGGGTALSSNTNNAAQAPDGNTTAGVLVTGAGSATWTQNITSNGGAYIVSVWARVTAGTASILFGLDGLSSSSTVTTTWQRFSFKRNSVPAGLIQCSIVLVTASTAYELWGGQVEAVTYQTSPSGTYYLNYPTPNTTSAYYGPRFDYDPVTLQPRGLLVEGQLQQLLSWSEDFRDTAAAGSTRPWSYVYATVSPNVTTAPDGSSNADALNEDATNNFNHLVGQTVTKAASALTYTFSTYIKAAGRNWSCITLWDGSANGIRFWYNVTLGAGAKGSQTSFGTGFSAVNYTITDVGNGWYRCSGTVVTNTATSLVSYIYSVSGDLNLAPVTALNAAGLYLFGAQVEARAFPTSYLPTQGGTSPFATRAAETFSLTGYANRLVEAYYIDEETGGSYSGNSALSTGTVTISPPTFGWVTSLRAYQNAYAGSISSPSWLSFSRAGNAMYYDSTGTLTWAPENLLLNSATLSTQSVVVTSPTVTTAGQLGSNYVLSFKGTGSVAITGTSLVFYTGSSTLAGTGASNRVSACFFAAQGTLTFTVTGTVTEAQLERVTYQTAPSAYIPTTSAAVYGPRYDYDPSTVPATPRGLLIEESRANLLTYSQDFGTGWSTYQTTTSGWLNVAVAPDGTTTADKLIDTTVNDAHIIYTSSTLTAASYTLTVYAKAAGRNIVYLRLDTGTAKYAYFDLSSGTKSNVNAAYTADIVPVGNGWYRCSITTTGTAASYSVVFGSTTASGTIAYAGDGVSGVFLWGAQLEAGSFATSYIPTTTASVTRAADVAQLTGSALTTLQGSAASAIVQMTSVPDAANGTPYILSGNSIQNNTLLQVYANNRISSKAANIHLPATIGGGGLFSTSVVRAAIGYSAAGRSSAANNGTLVTDTNAFTVPTNVALGGYSGGTNQINAAIQSFAAYNQRLPDAILKQKSTVGAPY